MCYLCHKLQKAAIQPLVDSMGNRLPTWKSVLLNRAGHVALTKSTLAAIPIYLSIALGLPAWAIKAMEKLMKVFIWRGTYAVSGGNVLLLGERFVTQQTWRVLAFHASPSKTTLSVFDENGQSVLTTHAPGLPY